MINTHFNIVKEEFSLSLALSPSFGCNSLHQVNRYVTFPLHRLFPVGLFLH